MRARIVVASILAVSGVLAAPAGATFKGRNGDLAFTARVDTTGPCNDMGGHQNCGSIFGNLFLARGGRGEPRQITECDVRRACDRWGPAFSPDGRRMAYTSASRVFVARADGTHPRLVAEDSAGPAWSPGGRELALTRRGGIYRLRLSDGRLLQVTSGQDGEPDWSSRGRIAFMRAFPSEAQGIYTVDAHGGDIQRVTTSYENGPTWSPDGNSLAYDRNSSLMIRGPGGSVRTILGAGGPSVWSPDGRLLAAPTSRRISVFRPSGTLVRAVRVPRGYVTGIAWQPRR